MYSVSDACWPRVGPGQSPYPFTFPLPHRLLYLLVSFIFPFSVFLLASSILMLFHPFPFYQNSLTPFSGWMS